MGVGAMAWAGLSPAPATPYNRRVGGDRRFAWVRTELDDLKAIKNSLGGTVNDVVLTVVARALRRDLDRRAFPIDGLELKVFVPISMRRDDQRGQTGNMVSGMVVALPVSLDDPVEVLQQIIESTRELKDSGQAVGAQALTELTGFAPPNVMDQAARLTARQRFINLVVTNVPGPQEPLEMAGRRLTDLFPIVPLGKNLGLGRGADLLQRRDRLRPGGGLRGGARAGGAGGRLRGGDRGTGKRGRHIAVLGCRRSPGRPRRRLGPADGRARVASGPEHVDTGAELVSESAQPGAEDGPAPRSTSRSPGPGTTRCAPQTSLIAWRRPRTRWSRWSACTRTCTSASAGARRHRTRAAAPLKPPLGPAAPSSGTSPGRCGGAPERVAANPADQGRHLVHPTAAGAHGDRLAQERRPQRQVEVGARAPPPA